MVKRDKGSHYIMIKWSLFQKDITIVNIFIPNIGAPKYIKEKIITKRRNRQWYSNSWGF